MSVLHTGYYPKPVRGSIVEASGEPITQTPENVARYERLFESWFEHPVAGKIFHNLHVGIAQVDGTWGMCCGTCGKFEMNSCEDCGLRALGPAVAIALWANLETRKTFTDLGLMVIE